MFKTQHNNINWPQTSKFWKFLLKEEIFWLLVSGHLPKPFIHKSPPLPMNKLAGVPMNISIKELSLNSQEYHDFVYNLEGRDDAIYWLFAVMMDDTVVSVVRLKWLKIKTSIWTHHVSLYFCKHSRCDKYDMPSKYQPYMSTTMINLRCDQTRLLLCDLLLLSPYMVLLLYTLYDGHQSGNVLYVDRMW